MNKKSKLKISNFKLILYLIFFLLLFIIARSFYRSAFFRAKDRINIVFNDEHPTFYSIGLADNVNYSISFFPDLEVNVPGGYGVYRLGALGKLADLEKKPELLKKTYSSVTSSFVDYYFYPTTSLTQKVSNSAIFFGGKKESFSSPEFYLIFFGKTNAGFFDRLYIFILFFGKTKGQFKIISTIPYENQGNRTIFSSSNFLETYQGYFYRTTYRTEKHNVQILYSKSYSTAQEISQILEGEGIKTVDLTQIPSQDKNCYMKEDKEKFSETAKDLSDFFACKLIRAKTGVYDIILQLGGREGEWEIE